MRQVGEDRDREVARIQVIKDGTVGEIRLNEPEVLNAQGRHWPEDMLAAAEEVGEDPEIIPEIVDPESGGYLPDGEIGEHWWRWRKTWRRSRMPTKRSKPACRRRSRKPSVWTLTIELVALQTVSLSESKAVRVLDERTSD